MAVIQLKPNKSAKSNKDLTDIYNQHKTRFILYARAAFPNFSELDAEEIYNDSFMVVYSDVQSGKLTELTCSLQTYINQIGKFKILDFYKKRKLEFDYIDDFQTKDFGRRVDDMWDNVSDDRKTKIYEFIDKMEDEKCKKIIFAFYYDNLSMDAIAVQLGLASKDVAKTTKNRCMKKIKSLLKAV